MKKLLFSSLMLIATLTYAQNKDKLTHPIDVDAIRETKLTGYIGLNPTMMSKPATPAQVSSFLKSFQTNWKSLGLSADQTTAYIPEIIEFQQARNIDITKEIELEGEKRITDCDQKKIANHLKPLS